MEQLLLHNQYGIDIGDNNIIVSVPKGSHCEVLSSKSGRITPAYVSFANGVREYGDIAKNNELQYISDIITDIKSLIGLKFNSDEKIELEERVKYDMVKLKNGYTGIKVESEDRIINVEEIIAYIFSILLPKGSHKTCDVVVAVPPNWSPARRQKLISTLQIADITVTKLVSTTAAAAVNYATMNKDKLPGPNDKSEITLFIDSGKSQTTVSLIRMKYGAVNVIGSKVNKFVNGSKLTDQLYQHMKEVALQKYKVDIEKSKRTSKRFMNTVNKLKENLTVNQVCPFEFSSMSGERDIKFNFTRDEFNEIIKDSVESITQTIENLLNEANVSKKDIKFVDLFGGNSLVPLFRKTVENCTGLQARSDSEECVALGCGYLTEMMENIILSDCADFEVTVEPSSSVVFPRNSHLPSSKEFNANENEFLFICGRENIGTLTIENPGNVILHLSESGTVIVDGQDVTYDDDGIIDDEEAEIIKTNIARSEESDKMITEVLNARNRLESSINKCERAIKDAPEYVAAQGLSIDAVSAKIRDARIFLEQNEFEGINIKPSQYDEISDYLDGVSSKSLDVKESHEDVKSKSSQFLNKANELLSQCKNDKGRNECEKFIDELKKQISLSKTSKVEFDENKWKRRLVGLENTIKLSSLM